MSQIAVNKHNGGILERRLVSFKGKINDFAKTGPLSGDYCTSDCL
jgi:hypothetical protein